MTLMARARFKDRPANDIVSARALFINEELDLVWPKN